MQLIWNETLADKDSDIHSQHFNLSKTLKPQFQDEANALQEHIFEALEDFPKIKRGLQKISKPNWIKKHLKSNDNSKNKLIYKIKNNQGKKTKYFNYIELSQTNLNSQKDENNYINIFIKTNLNTDYESFDYIYEKTKTYTSIKRLGLKKINWGRINATSGI